MNKIKKDDLVEMIQSELFENSTQINLPVDGGMYIQNTKGSHFDRPYAQKDQIPLATSDIVTNKVALNTKNFDARDKEFLPDNMKEFTVALSSIIDDAGINNIPKEDLHKMWKIFTKYLEKLDK